MSPAISVHRPRGLLPKVVVQKRTVVDYQPSWLLLLIPALAVLRARRRKLKAQVGEAELDAELSDFVEPSGQRWRRPRLRGRTVPPTALPDSEAGAV